MEKKFLLQNLRIVDVLGDRNCYFRALSHQPFGDVESHQIIRQAAADKTQNYIQNLESTTATTALSILCYRYERIGNG